MDKIEYKKSLMLLRIITNIAFEEDATDQQKINKIKYWIDHKEMI